MSPYSFTDLCSAAELLCSKCSRSHWKMDRVLTVKLSLKKDEFNIHFARDRDYLFLCRRCANGKSRKLKAVFFSLYP